MWPCHVLPSLTHCLPRPCLPVRSVANMFFIPMGMTLGAPVTWAQAFLNNILPVTLGNTIAGFFMMACAYSLSYGALGKNLAPKPAAA